MLKEATKTILQLVLMNDTGDSMHRMRWPAEALSKQAPEWRIINLDASAEERFTWAEQADLLILFQCADLDLLPILRKRRSLGRKTLVEYNDNFYEAPRWLPFGAEWRSPLLWQTYEQFMRLADGVLVTGPGLYDLFRSKGFGPLHILKNHFPWSPKPFEQVWREPTTEIHLGWAGSLGHIADLLAVLPTLRRLAQDFPQLTFHFMGNKTIPELLHLSPDRYRFTHWGGMKDYLEFWKGLHLGIAPLLDTAYNRCRSDVKAIEMSAQGVLPILTDFLPYREFLERTSAPRFQNWQQLYEQIKNLLEQPAQISMLTRKCYEYVCQERLQLSSSERLEVYSQYLSSASNSFSWPVDSGYFEITGKTQKTSRQQQALENAQQALNKKDLNSASSILRKAIDANPDNPHLILAAIRCEQGRGAAADMAQLRQLLEHGKHSFPLDARFRLHEIALTGETSQRISLWEDLLRFLKTQTATYQSFFRPEIIKLAIKDQANKIMPLPLAESLLDLYPQACELLLMLAERYDADGDVAKSTLLFAELSKCQELFLVNQEYIKNLQPGYVDARLEGLKHSK